MIFNYRFNVEELGFQTGETDYGIILVVDQKVDVTVTQLTIGPFALLSRFGGIIGVGRMFNPMDYIRIRQTRPKVYRCDILTT